MCVPLDARPPLPPIAGAAAEQGDLVLTAADGNRFAAYAARAADPGGAGVVILPDVRGTTPEGIQADVAAAVAHLRSAQRVRPAHRGVRGAEPPEWISRVRPAH